MFTVRKSVNAVKKKRAGEMAVEAAFIIPLMLIILFLFVYIMFALHDRAILLMRADMMLEDNTAPFLEKTVEESDIGKGLFIYKIKSFEVIKNGFFFTVNLEAEAKIRLGLIDKLIGGYRYYSIHKMHRAHDYCKERRMLAVVREESE